MSQSERDRLVALKKANEKKVTQRKASEELGISERQVRRILAKMRKVGDQAVVHGLGGRSNRNLSGHVCAELRYGWRRVEMGGSTCGSKTDNCELPSDYQRNVNISKVVDTVPRGCPKFCVNVLR